MPFWSKQRTPSLRTFSHFQVSRLKKDYDDLDEQITRKEEMIADQLEESEEAARRSEEVESAINEKLATVADLTEK